MAPSDKINAAVRACLDQAYRSTDRLAAKERFLAHLRASAAWSDEEVSTIADAVNRILLPDRPPAEDDRQS